MGHLLFAGAHHEHQLFQARQRFFDRGEIPDDLLDQRVIRSWERCLKLGLNAEQSRVGSNMVGMSCLRTEQEKNRFLLDHAQPIMEHVYQQIAASGSMVLLADANGMLLQSIGDPDFVDRAGRVALSPGASWEESERGTNAIGTALAEERATEILGAEHFLEHNGFLTCAASPIFGPDGRLHGVLDISGDYRTYQRHTLGLARMSALMVEKRLFESRHSRDILISFHSRSGYLGSPGEGLAAVSPDGQILAINQTGLEILGIRRVDAVRRDFSMVFNSSLASLMDRQRRDPLVIMTLNGNNGEPLYLRLGGLLPPIPVAGRLYDLETPARASSAAKQSPAGKPLLTLEALSTGDTRLQLAIERARRILGKDIPILIQGESGAGKEMFAKAFHNSGPRQSGPFVALNCAAIPETLIESELFGYQGGAFTGARKEGAPGKIQQAHGGTLFLDEIGDMPLNMQARLLRVLQERCITPLGSTKSIQVDISLVCATHRKLKEEVAQRTFREDLYYRLNGLSVTLPALRERSDIRELARKLLRCEAGEQDYIRFSETAMEVIESYGWPGNIRQLHNVIRVALALLDEGETEIGQVHLPEELFETEPLATREFSPASPSPMLELPNQSSLEDIGRQAAQRALDMAGGNISAAARQLGISRNTLYRKLGKL